MTAYYGDKKIKGIYLGTQNTNCLTYIPEDVKVRLDPIAWTQPTLTANGTMGGDSFACSQQAYYTETDGRKQEAWRMFSSGTAEEWQINSVSTSSTYWAKFYNPEVIKISKFQVINPSSGVSNNSPAKVVLYGSNDDSTYTEMGVLTDITTTASAVFDLYLTHSDWYKYYKVEVTPRNTAAVAIGRLKITAITDNYIVLEKGSKVYVPNGFESNGTTPKYDEVVTTSDIKITGSAINTGSDVLLYYRKNTKDFRGVLLSNQNSGSTNPNLTYSIWFDTDNNLIKCFGTDITTPNNYSSFPFAYISFNAQRRIVGIKQVFNGFGYIGSTVFALPGVKGFIPHGYNTDGTYKSDIINVTKVLLCTDTSTRNNQDIRLSSTVTRYGNLDYNSTLNQNEVGGSFRGFASVGKISVSDGKITSLTPNRVQPAKTGREISRIYNGSTLVYGYKPEQVLFEKSTAGTYTLNLEHSGDYEVTIVGGGGGGAYNASKKFSDGVISGGSGAGFKGVIHLKAGTHTVKVGAGGTSVNPGNQPTAMPGVGSSSSIGNIITAGCANADGTANAGVHGSGNVISKGGVLRYDSSVVKSYTLATNGNDGLEGWNTSVEGASSVISGTTYGAGDKGQNGAMSKGYDGYVKIVAI